MIEGEVTRRRQGTHRAWLSRVVPALIGVALATGCNSRGAADNLTTTAPAVSPPRATEPGTGDDKAQATATAPKPTGAGESFATFEAYWPAFRAAVQSNDKQRVATLTRFPFETRGDSDDDAVKQLTREQFVHALDSMLSEDPGLLMNGRETQREHIARSATLTARQYASGDETARVGNFQFEKQGGNWWFTRAYVSEE